MLDESLRVKAPECSLEIRLSLLSYDIPSPQTFSRQHCVSIITFNVKGPVAPETSE